MIEVLVAEVHQHLVISVVLEVLEKVEMVCRQQ
jgi:hypothetical protein